MNSRKCFTGIQGAEFADTGTAAGSPWQMGEFLVSLQMAFPGRFVSGGDADGDGRSVVLPGHPGLSGAADDRNHLFGYRYSVRFFTMINSFSLPIKTIKLLEIAKQEKYNTLLMKISVQDILN